MMLKYTFSRVFRVFVEKAVFRHYKQHSKDHYSQRGVAVAGRRVSVRPCVSRVL